MKHLVQDAVNYLISMAISILGMLGLWVFWAWVFWDFGCFGLGYFGFGYFVLPPYWTQCIAPMHDAGAHTRNKHENCRKRLPERYDTILEKQDEIGWET